MARVDIRLSDEELAKWKARCAEEPVLLSEWIRRLCNEDVEAWGVGAAPVAAPVATRTTPTKAPKSQRPEGHKRCASATCPHCN